MILSCSLWSRVLPGLMENNRVLGCRTSASTCVSGSGCQRAGTGTLLQALLKRRVSVMLRYRRHTLRLAASGVKCLRAHRPAELADGWAAAGLSANARSVSTYHELCVRSATQTLGELWGSLPVLNEWIRSLSHPIAIVGLISPASSNLQQHVGLIWKYFCVLFYLKFPFFVRLRIFENIF